MIVATLPEPTVRPPSRSFDVIGSVITNEKSLVYLSECGGFSLYFTQFLNFGGQSWVRGEKQSLSFFYPLIVVISL